jgi:hypothetical protein
MHDPLLGLLLFVKNALKYHTHSLTHSTHLFCVLTTWRLNLQKEAGDVKTTQKQAKTPLGQRFGEWLHHTPSSAEDEHTYCGTRNTKKWRA